MPRAIWSGAISFGLVNVPVRMYSAVSKKTVRFHQLHDADGVRLRQKRVCPADEQEVPYEHVVKGYELSPDRYVVITQAELDALDPEATRTIDIEDFVDLADIDPIYFDHPYYLAPATGSAKPYALLRDAMASNRKVAIAKVVIRSKQQLCAIRATGEVLSMATMLFGDEVVDAGSLDELDQAAAGDASERELDMARSLIDSLSSDFDPSKYRDSYREAVLELVERKAAGEEVAVQPEPETPREETPDLMAALEASLKSVRQAEGGGAKGGAKRGKGKGKSRTASGQGKGSGSSARKRETAKR